MFYRILILMFFITCSLQAFSETFVVTSNADSGPGTMREALAKAAANGSSEKDYINFNFPDVSEEGRTIKLVSQLDPITSDVTIDGTTQAGNRFGVSDTKVKIVYNFPKDYDTSLPAISANSVTNLTISGLWLFFTIGTYQYDHFIQIEHAGNVVINHCVTAGDIYINDCQNFTLQSSFIGYLPDGITGYICPVDALNCHNTIIGGPEANQGNLIGGSIDIFNTTMRNKWSYMISNNKMGADYTGTLSSPSLYLQGRGTRITVEIGYVTNPLELGNVEGIISNNLIVNFSATGIELELPGGTTTITGNHINTDASGSINFTSFAPEWAGIRANGIIVENLGTTIIGGPNPEDKNVLGYLLNGILEQQAGDVIITQNSIFCITRGTHHFIFPNPYYPEQFTPVVDITSITSHTIIGTATPNARVELFSSRNEGCPECDPKYFFTAVISDAKGNWNYTGDIPPNVVASSIYKNRTSLFTKAEINTDNIKVIQPTCSTLGSIEGISIKNTTSVTWTDFSGNIISNSLDIKNLKPGKYKLQIGSDVCGSQSDWIEINNPLPEVDASNIKIINPSCGNNKGSIKGIVITPPINDNVTTTWLNSTGQVLGSNVEIVNLSAGEYSLQIKGGNSNCTTTYGPITLSNTTGPNINQTQPNTAPTTCGKSTGSITGITATGNGTLTYSWKNATGQEVSTSPDLTGQPAGMYTLQVTDESSCGPVYSSQFEIKEENGITLDESKAQIIQASCNSSNGSITGITITGATTYQWYNSITQKLVSTQTNLTGMPAGDYYLVATNTFCSKQSATYHITEQSLTKFPTYSFTIIPSCYQGNNGSIKVSINDNLPKAYRWSNSAHDNVGSQATLTDVPAGQYQLYLTDGNGCESYYNTYTVNELAEFKIPIVGNVTADQCDLKIGSISAATITGGRLPYTYTWHNAEHQTIGSAASISHLAAGRYILHVTDAGCGIADVSYQVDATTSTVLAPSVSNLQLCSSGMALLMVNDANASTTYRLYDSANSFQPLDEQHGGTFKINVKANKTYYISQLNGTCESSRAELQISVGLSAINIANTFSPNGDGINDYWLLKGIENYPAALIQLYNRYGQKVYESKGYNKQFDGTVNGKELPVGTYYYIINLSSKCNLLSGSLTLIR